MHCGFQPAHCDVGMQKALNSDEEKFIAMLEQAQVRASAQWPAVSEHFAPDPRFTAVPKESRFVLFRSYIRMQQDMNALKLDDTERELSLIHI